MLFRGRFFRALLPSIVTVGYASIVALKADANGSRILCILVALVLAARAAQVEWQVAIPTWALAMSLACSLSFDRALAMQAGFGTVAVSFAIAGHQLTSTRRRWVLAGLLALPAILLAFAPSIVLGLVLLAIVLCVLRAEHVMRRLELGASERLVAITFITMVVFVVATALVVTKTAHPSSVVLACSATIAFAIAHLAQKGDPANIANITRRAMVALTIASPFALFIEMTLLDRPRDAGTILLLAVAGGVLAGVASAPLSRTLRPANGVWLDAMERAMVDRLRADPDEAIRLTLVRLREAAGPRAAAPELRLVHPPRAITVDAAGYTREREAPDCAFVIDTAMREPEGILRTEVLASLEVRRADLRPTLAWMREQEALCAVLIVYEGEVEGLLVVPRGDRTEPLSIEEARALKSLSDGLAGACAVRASLARSREREMAHEKRADEFERAADVLAHTQDIHRERDAHMAARLARPATVGLYSGASRTAYEAIEKRAKQIAPIVVLAKSGVDPVPYVARAHQSGGKGPLVIVDATQAREHDLDRWKHKSRSPLALANGGLLVLVDGAVLPRDVQQFLANALAEKRAPWDDALDIALALTSAWSLDHLRETIDPTLAARLGDGFDHAVTLPSLSERGEDLRALLVDRLAREGMRVRGRPVGIEDAAFAAIVDYPFPGEDAELAALAHRLVAICEGDVVRRSDISKLGLEMPTTRKIRGV